MFHVTISNHHLVGSLMFQQGLGRPPSAFEPNPRIETIGHGFSILSTFLPILTTKSREILKGNVRNDSDHISFEEP